MPSSAAAAATAVGAPGGVAGARTLTRVPARAMPRCRPVLAIVVITKTPGFPSCVGVTAKDTLQVPATGIVVPRQVSVITEPMVALVPAITASASVIAIGAGPALVKVE